MQKPKSDKGFIFCKEKFQDSSAMDLSNDLSTDYVQGFTRIVRRRARAFMSVFSILTTILVFMAGCSDSHSNQVKVDYVSDTVTIDFDDQLVPHIKASLFEEAIFAQGYLHGRLHGKQVAQAVQAFKGDPKDLKGDFELLSNVFQTFPMNQLAEECLKTYRRDTLSLLTSYLKGFKTAYPESSLTTKDLIILQRGYAFLMSDVLGQAWFSYQAQLPAQKTSPFEVVQEYLPLFKGPALEMVRSNRRLPLHQQFRTSPDWWFVPQPIRISTTNFHAEGMGLAGLPFLWSGSNTNIQIVQTPMMGSSAVLFGFDSESAELIDVMGKTESPLQDLVKGGVKICAFSASKKSNLVPRFFWTGFRPSSEIQSLIDLFKATSIEEASYCHEFFQVPVCEVLIATPKFAPLLRVIGTKDLSLEKIQSNQYTFPFIGNAYENLNLVPNIQGFNFSSNDLTTDEELIQTLNRWLNGPLKMILSKSDWDRVNSILAHPSHERNIALQLLWQDLLTDAGEQWSPMFTMGRSLEARRELLELYSRETNIDLNEKSQARMQTLANLLSNLVMDLGNQAESGESLSYYLPQSPKTTYPLPDPGPSLDNPNSLFYAGFQTEILRAATHEMDIDDLELGLLKFRSWPFALTGEPKEPIGSRWKPMGTITLEPKEE